MDGEVDFRRHVPSLKKRTSEHAIEEADRKAWKTRSLFAGRGPDAERKRKTA